MNKQPVAYLVEFESGEIELHLAQDGLPGVGSEITPLYAMPDDDGPSSLVGALQDSVHRDPGPVRAPRSNKQLRAADQTEDNAKFILQTIVEHYDMRFELFTCDADCAATLAALAREYLADEEKKA